MVYKKRNWKKRWQALQVNLGHFIKNRCHNKEDWKRRVWAAGTCWVTMVRVFFWYYSCYCKYYASSAFQHRENISTCAHETVFLFSVLYRRSGLLKKKVWKRKSVWPDAGKRKKEKKLLPSSSLACIYLKRFKCHIRGNALVFMYRALTGCTAPRERQFDRE